MEELAEVIIDLDYENMDELVNQVPIDKRFGLKINYNNERYEFLIHLKSNADKIYCFGSGALPPKDRERFKKRPIFKRQSWDNDPEMNVSTIFYNDPTRYKYPNLSVTWGIGTPEDYYLKNMGLILEKFFQIVSIDNSDVVFYSSSMGGFMSICLASMIKGSIAWADIPQTNLRNYPAFSLMLNDIFSDYDDINEFNYRFDCIEFIKKENHIPHIYFVMSCGFQDLIFHDVPFIDKLRMLEDYDTKKNILKILINPEDDHTFLSKEQFFTVMEKYSHFENFDEIPDLAILDGNDVKVITEKLGTYYPMRKDKVELLYGELSKHDLIYGNIHDEKIKNLEDIIKKQELEIKKLKEHDDLRKIIEEIKLKTLLLEDILNQK